jgi:Mg/Co/Ni transporter MgtE
MASDPLLSDFARTHTDEFAAVLARGERSELVDVLQSLPAPLAVAVAARLPQQRLSELDAAERERLAGWLGEADFDDAAALVGRLPREAGLALVAAVADPQRQHRLAQFLHFPEHCVGAVVSSVPVQVQEDTPLPGVLAELRAAGSGEPVPAVVLSAAARLLGELDLWKLLLRGDDAGQAGDYARPIPVLHPEISLVAASELPHWSEHAWLPVVDHDDRLLGCVSSARVAEASAALGEQVDLVTDSVVDVSSQFFRVSGDLLDRLLVDRS